MKNSILLIMMIFVLYSCSNKKSNQEQNQKINYEIDSLTFYKIKEITKSNEIKLETLLNEFCTKIGNQGGLINDVDAEILFSDKFNLYEKLFTLNNEYYKIHLVFFTERIFAEENIKVMNKFSNNPLKYLKISTEIQKFPNYQTKLEEAKIRFYKTDKK